MAAAKKKENALEDVVLVASTQQNLSNLYSLDIYAVDTWDIIVFISMERACRHVNLEIVVYYDLYVVNVNA